MFGYHSAQPEYYWHQGKPHWNLGNDIVHSNFYYTFLGSLQYFLIQVPDVLVYVRNYKLAAPRIGFFLVQICHAITDPPVTKIRLWASFGL